MASTISAGTTSSTALVATADTTGALQLATNNGTVAVTVDTSQNVGIGTSSPAYKLALESASNFSIHLLKTSSNDGWVRNIGTMDIAAASGGSGGQVITFSTGSNYAGLTERARIDGSGNIKLSTAGTKILNSSGNAILNQTGSILQVVSATKTDTFSTTSTSPVDVTGLSLSITPSSTSSKIFITGSVCWGEDSSVPYLVGFLLVRNSTSICIADAAGSRSRWTFGGQGVYSTDNTVFAPLNFLDSPATTSATTYKVQVQAESPRTVWINRGGESDGDTAVTGRFTSTITVMEIAG
jgi:hypothetical protein